MPGVVEEYVREQREKAFSEGFSVTKSHLEGIYFNNKTNNGWDAYLTKSEPWSIAEEREFVQNVAHRENHFIAQAQDTPSTRYAADEAYRLGAREAVMQFSHENNHRLLQSEREEERVAQRERIRVG